MSVGISTELIGRIAAQAAASPHAEVCGLLFGGLQEITAIQPCPNVAADPGRRFEIDPAALIAAHRAARSGGLRLLGHYHSHPGGSAMPSLADAREAAPDGSLWLIAAEGDVRAWRSGVTGDVHGRFTSVPLACTPTAPPPQEPPNGETSGMSVSPVDFASLLCSRLCHDLLSPVGALNNGLELLADETDPKMRERCMELLAESARTSANKLKFFRLAFGAAGGFGEQVDAREARSAIEGLFSENKRTEIGWLVDAATIPKPAAKVLLNLAMIAGDALVRGGQLDIGGEENEGHFEIVVRAEGPRLILDPDIRRTLVDGESDDGVTPRVAAAYLVHSLGGGVQVSEPADNVMLFGASLAA